MFGHNRVIVMTTVRASLSDRCQEAVAQADMRQQGCAQTGADPTLLQRCWLRLDSYRLGQDRNWSWQHCRS